ncbi:nucleotidyltransferase domain-containing protein [Candidatus Pacearchaeota archaeon]|nr:nucleotidyltransferase domain-containing protein [Candidatus Pacearchaeota archaeon]
MIGLLQKFLDKVKKTTRIEKAILFGSTATGKAHGESDVDILIISKDFKNVKSYKRSPQFYLAWNLPYDGDILCLTPEEFEKKKKQIGIIKTAVEEGIEL